MADPLSTPDNGPERSAIAAALRAINSSATRAECMSGEELAAFLDGRTSTHAREVFIAHLSTCEACQRRLIQLADITRIAAGDGSIEQSLVEPIAMNPSLPVQDIPLAAEHDVKYRVFREPNPPE